MDEFKEAVKEIKSQIKNTGRARNPFAGLLLKYGYTTKEHHEDGSITETYYSPEEVRDKREKVLL